MHSVTGNILWRMISKQVEVIRRWVDVADSLFGSRQPASTELVELQLNAMPHIETVLLVSVETIEEADSLSADVDDVLRKVCWVCRAQLDLQDIAIWLESLQTFFAVTRSEAEHRHAVNLHNRARRNSADALNIRLQQRRILQRLPMGHLSVDLSRCHHALGAIYDESSDFKRAIHHKRKDLTITLEKYGLNHQSTAAAFFNLGITLIRNGMYDAAIAHLSKALAIDLDVRGPQHPATAAVYDSIGCAFLRKGMPDESIVYHSKALAIFIKNLGEDHQDVAISLNNLGNAYDAKGQYSKAIALHNRALEVHLAALGPSHRLVAASYSCLGNLYDSTGDYDKALDCQNKALAIKLN
jgi:tetratricopeptide (TPR) repeat protein